LNSHATTSSLHQHLQSVDALRGLSVAAMLLVNDPGDWGHVYAPLRHAEWHGCTPTDLIFPLFLVIVGVSASLSISPRVESAVESPALDRKVIVRSLRIVLLGLVLNLFAYFAFDAAHFRVMGVLQRIGLCYLATGLVAVHMTARVRWLLIAALLLGYWVLLVVGGGLEVGTNLASRIDTSVLGQLAYQFDPSTHRAHDPEGLLSTLAAIATTLLGFEAGEWLRAGRERRLWIAAGVLLVVGWLWSMVLPFNKNLWSPSYVAWSGGWAFLLLAISHALIDVRGWPPVGRSLGVNAIAAYAGAAVMVYLFAALGWSEMLYQRAFADWMTPRFGPFVPSFTYALSFMCTWWILMWLFDRRGIRIRI
jgi:predicted acyltransferase